MLGICNACRAKHMHLSGAQARLRQFIIPAHQRFLPIAASIDQHRRFPKIAYCRDLFLRLKLLIFFHATSSALLREKKISAHNVAVPTQCQTCHWKLTLLPQDGFILDSSAF